MREKSQQQLALKRTELAFQRSLLSEQRTYSAWIRTGLAAIVLGFAVVKFLAQAGPKWLVYVVGGILISIGILIQVLSFWNYYGIVRRLKRKRIPGLPLWSVALIAFSLFLSEALILALILREASVLSASGPLMEASP